MMETKSPQHGKHPDPMAVFVHEKVKGEHADYLHMMDKWEGRVYRGKGQVLKDRGDKRRYQLAYRKEGERMGLFPRGKAQKKAAKRENVKVRYGK